MAEKINKYIKGEDHLRASGEFLFVWFFSLLPLFFNMLFWKEEANTWLEVLKMNFEREAIFVHATTLLAPAMFTLYKIQKAKHERPNYLVTWGIIVVLLIACTFIVCTRVTKPELLANVTNGHPNLVMLIIYVACLWVWYRSLVYNNLLEHLEKDVDLAFKKQGPSAGLRSSMKGFKTS